MSQPDADQKLAEIKTALFAGRKIEAIKLYREALGGGLAEAKAAVEKLEAELRVTAPDQFKSPPAKSGCTAVLAVVMVIVLGAVILSLAP